ncbi:SAGA complex subunit/TATA-binding protein associated factor/transcription factor TFIID complex subunit Taf5 [Schizosaccharomyces cryophilus OY26]|uniref:SAGA complex subunit/TATA-binding protein associated factor/transcription factor TFIID complex subunit Taf5 n=1 Tax=Schizosaccharomyces cryophilus (strain OY26 / ATCC MYA-4695 / CBS 11777 / NBRC 106824 / NRRL Y48691) TaxID=653667 RepID=S9VPN0_SCHCR|nr:SAGA complex subunit/TATA-binding protein associated factor/transcription factor TFIID complex subunit Taf5 [Schizosaccharomyces cryophilus OY26]EPY49888.1 SAGA complex subunit/TATA-binding protein associated factor/transcription factor TFIID complex subunit Taf5 [Schizosaccharomyces cryophilus OY26]
MSAGNGTQAQDLNRIVLDYLAKKGYARTEAMLRLEASDSGISVEEKLKNIRETPDAYAHTYTLLRDWVDSSLELYKSELRRILFPIFVHSFLDLLSLDRYDTAKQFYDMFMKDHEDLHSWDVKCLKSLSLPSHVDEDLVAQQYRKNKYQLNFSRITFDLLLHFLFENISNGGTVIIQLINRHVDIHIVPGRPSLSASYGILNEQEGITGQLLDRGEGQLQPVRLSHMPMDKEMEKIVEMDLEEEDMMHMDPETKQSTSNLLGEFRKNHPPNQEDAPSRDYIPLPPHKGADITSEVEAVKDWSKRLHLGPRASLPSVCMYTFHDTDGAMNCAEFSPDTTMIASGFQESYIRLWSLKPDKKSASRTANEPASDSTRLLSHSGPIYGTKFSPDNKYLLSCSEDRSARLWSVDTKTALVAYKGHSGPIWDVAFGPFGHYFATASHDQTALLWSCDHIYPLRVFAGHLSDVDCVTFHPNSAYVLTGSNDKTCRLWDVHRGHSVRIFNGHTKPVTAVAIAPDGHTVASADYDGLIHLWDIGSGRRIKTMKGHQGGIYSLSFSQESTVLVSGGADYTVRAWDVLKTNYSDSVSSSLAGSVVTPYTNTESDALESTAAWATSPDQMVRLNTKQTPIYHVSFTRRNLCMSISVS